LRDMPNPDFHVDRRSLGLQCSGPPDTPLRMLHGARCGAAAPSPRACVWRAALLIPDLNSGKIIVIYGTGMTKIKYVLRA